MEMRGRDLGRGFLITLAVFCFASVSWGQGADQTERVLFNAKVFTGIPDHPYADAVAIRGDKIVAVGSLAEVSAIDPSATRVDLQGKFLLPGLIDSHAPALRALPASVTWTCRLPKTAVLYALAPPRTGKRGRPRTKGGRLGTPADLARTAQWTTCQVPSYHGRTDIKHTAAIRCLWYGSFRTREVTVVLSRDEHTTSGYSLALVTTDLATAQDPAAIVARYVMRWSIEVSYSDSRNVLGAGEARNRSRKAVERTVPFALPLALCSPTPCSSAGPPGTAPPRPTSPPAAPSSRGTPKRPSRPSKT